MEATKSGFNLKQLQNTTRNKHKLPRNQADFYNTDLIRAPCVQHWLISNNRIIDSCSLNLKM